MAIEGLSENVRMPRLGKIRLGRRDPQKGYPIKSDYFVLPEDHPDYHKLTALYGEHPKELRVLIPVEDINEWAPQFLKAYDLTHGLICKGDGVTAKRMVDVATGKFPTKETKTTTFKDMDCLGKQCPEYQDKKCGEVMNLLFILADVPGLGVWQIDTGSINSILNINSCAKLIKSIYKRITGVPLKLTLEPHTVNNPENGRKQTVYVLNLRTDFTLEQLAAAARHQNQQFMLETPDMAAVYEENVERNIKELWPDNMNPDGEAVKAIAAAKEVKEPASTQQPPEKSGDSPATPGPEEYPETLDELLRYAAQNGKSGSWVAKQANVTFAAEIPEKDYKNVYLTIKQVGNWKPYKKGGS